MIDFDISKVVACARRRNTDLSQTMPSHANPKEYLRFGDGDYELSAVEEEGFVIGRTRPRFDEIGVVEAQSKDLDADLVVRFVAQARLDSEGLATFQDQELLVKTGVLTGVGVPTVAGAVALGQSPQQFLPTVSIRAAFLPIGAARGRLRALDEATFTGPVTPNVGPGSGMGPQEQPHSHRRGPNYRSSLRSNLAADSRSKRTRRERDCPPRFGTVVQRASD